MMGGTQDAVEHVVIDGVAGELAAHVTAAMDGVVEVGGDPRPHGSHRWTLRFVGGPVTLAGRAGVAPASRCCRLAGTSQ
jgi:hypothetical protein